MIARPDSKSQGEALHRKHVNGKQKRGYLLIPMLTSQRPCRYLALYRSGTAANLLCVGEALFANMFYIAAVLPLSCFACVALLFKQPHSRVSRQD